MGLSTWDLESGSNADRGCESKGHFASTQPKFGSKLRVMLRGSDPTVHEIAPSSAIFIVWSLHETTLNPGTGIRIQ